MHEMMTGACQVSQCSYYVITTFCQVLRFDNRINASNIVKKSCDNVFFIGFTVTTLFACPSVCYTCHMTRLKLSIGMTH